MPTLYQQRSQFEKQILAAVTPGLRGTPWKRSGRQVFARLGNYFVSASISVHLNDARTTVVLSFKPMGLDPVLWDILGIGENRDRPLSFRANGAFTCTGLPVLERDLEVRGHTPEQVAASLLQMLEADGSQHEESLASAGFSELVAVHPNHAQRGAYAITLVTSLILDGEENAARDLARAYATGAKFSCSQMTSMGRSLHDLAIQWIESGQSARRAISSVS